MNVISVIYFLVAGIILLFLWLRMLGILQEKGLSVSYWVLNPADYFYFWEVIKKEKDKTKKKEYYFIFWILLILTILYIPGLAILSSIS